MEREADRQLFDHLAEFVAWRDSAEGQDVARQLTREGSIGVAHGEAMMKAFQDQPPEVTQQMLEAVERLEARKPPPPPPDGQYPPLRPVN